MKNIRRLSLLISFIIMAFCSQISAAAFQQSQRMTTDTIPAETDSTLYEEDCITAFMNTAGKLKSATKTYLVTQNNKTVTLQSILKPRGNFFSANNYGLKDLDNDGKKELVLYEYTGGMHCCDIVSIYKNIAPGKYKFVSSLYAGTTCITAENEIQYDFYEQFGYFFTCYMCEYTDSTENAPEKLFHITFRYSNGKLNLTRAEEAKKVVVSNLQKLSKQPYKSIPEDGQDNGLRKEFAINLAVYYFSDNKNVTNTKKLFDQYYHYPDASVVWRAFTANIREIKSNSRF